MRKITLIFCFALLLASFASCNKTQDENVSSISSSNVSSYVESQEIEPTSVPSPPAELKTPGEITVYVASANSDIFESYVVPIDKEDATLLDIADAVAKQLEVTIPIKSIIQQKGMVTVDLSDSFLTDYGKEEAERILTTLAITLQENHFSFETVLYQENGEAGVFGSDLWNIPPLKLVEDTADEYAAIRAKVPYEGLREYNNLGEPIIETDETGTKLTRFISYLPLFEKDILSPKDIDNKQALKSVIFATKGYFSSSQSEETYAPELKPLEAPISETLGFREEMFWLKEHIEASAHLLFGNDFEIKHEDANHYTYHETVGVYTPPYMGGGFINIPIIFSYEDLGDSYKVELAYIVRGMDGYVDPDTDNRINENELKQYAENNSKRREIILKKTADGNFTFVSHKYL